MWGARVCLGCATDLWRPRLQHVCGGNRKPAGTLFQIHTFESGWCTWRLRSEVKSNEQNLTLNKENRKFLTANRKQRSKRSNLSRHRTEENHCNRCVNGVHMSCVGIRTFHRRKHPAKELVPNRTPACAVTKPSHETAEFHRGIHLPSSQLMTAPEVDMSARRVS